MEPETWLVPRARGGAVEVERDREVLRWIARFQGVTAELVSWRFGVSVQRANARLRRLEAAGLVVRRGGYFQELYVSVTRRGLTALGLPRRRPPGGVHGQFDQLVVAALVVHLELSHAGARVMTQREMRDDGFERYAVSLRAAGNRAAHQRLPALCVDAGDGLAAVEVIHRGRPFEHLVGAYSSSKRFEAVWLYVKDPAVAGRLANSIARRRPELPAALAKHHRFSAVSARPWPGLDEATHAAVDAALRPSP